MRFLNELDATSIQFVGGTGTQGTMSWNSEDETVDLVVSPDVTYQLGQELGIVARNISGAALSNGDVVKVTGASGNKVTVDLADASTEADSSATFAIVTEDISNNSTGFITTNGLVRGLNTSAFTEGDDIWLGTSGAFTDTKPTSPDHLVHIGWIVRSHATEGMILVKISNGWELDELHDVLITSITDGELLLWDNTAGVWKNQTLSEAGISAVGHTHAYDNYGSWNLRTNGVQRTTVTSGGILDIVASTNVSVSYSAGGRVSISSTDTNTWRGIDDVPVNGQTAESISSNWAYDHANASNPHGITLSTIGAASSSHNHDSDYLHEFGTSAQSNINTIAVTSGKYRWNNTTTGRPASAQSNEYGTVLNLNYDGTNTTQLAHDIDQENLWIRTLNTSTDTGTTWKRLLTTSDSSSFATSSHTHAQYAPLASPTFTGTPAAPTAAAGTNTTQLATTAFVSTAVSNLVDSAPTTLDTLNELAAALGDDPNFATTVTTSIATKLPLAGGTLTGNLVIGSNAVPKDLTIYGSLAGEFMQYDGSVSLLKLHGKTNSPALEIYTNGAAQPTTHQVKIGRDSGQYYGIRVDDGYAHLVHRQDETGSGAHHVRNEIWTSTTGTSTWAWRKADNAGASASEIMKLESSGTLKLGGGSNTITNTKVGNWDTAYGWGDHASAGYAASSHTHAASDVTSGTFSTARIPNLDTSKITSGEFNKDRVRGIKVSDTRNTNSVPNSYNKEVEFDFKTLSTIGGPTTSNTVYGGLMTIAPWQDDSGDAHHQLLFAGDGGTTSTNGYIAWRTGKPSGTTTGDWYSWKKLWTENDFTSTNVSNWDTAYGWGDHGTEGYATQTWTNTQIANLVDSAPATLDTLNELAAALGDDPNFATTMTNSLAGKVAKAGDTMTGNLTVGNGTAANAVKVYHSDGTWSSQEGTGMVFSRGSSYLRPSANNTKNLYIGGYATGDYDWSVIRIHASTLYWNGNTIATQTWANNQFALSSHNHDADYVNVSGDTMTGLLTFSKSVYGGFDSENFYRIKLQDQGGVYNDVGIGQTVSGSMGFNITNTGAFIFNNGTGGEIARLNGTGLGIGTTSPDTAIHAYDATAANITPLLKLQHSATANDNTEGVSIDFVGSSDKAAVGSRIIATRAAAGAHMDLRFHTQRDDFAMIIDENQRVGIGTTSPSSSLDVHGQIRGEQITLRDAANTENHGLLYSNGTEGVLTLSNGNNWGMIARGNTNNPYVGAYFQGSMTFRGFGNSLGSNHANDRDLMKLDFANERVGIGTTSPSSKLHINGDVKVGTNISVTNTFGNKGTNKGINFESPSTALQTARVDADAFRFYFGGTGGAQEVMRILESGNVGIKTTAPRTLFHVSGIDGDDDPALGAASGPFFVSNTAGSYGLLAGVQNSGDAWIQSQSVTAATAYDLNLQPLGGNVGIGTTSPGAALDVVGTIKTNAHGDSSQWSTAYGWGNHASAGYAPLASPTFTGTPAAPTAAAGTNTTQLATTAFVSTAVSNLVDSAPTTLDTLNELAAALGDDPNFATTVTNSIATKLPLSGGTLTGTLTANTDIHLVGSMYNGGVNAYSIDLRDHSSHAWFRNEVGYWTFQTGSSGDDWTQSFSLRLPAAGSTVNAVWAELGQTDSNDVSGGRYRGLRIVKDTGGIVDGDIRAGAYYVGTTRKDQNWDTAYSDRLKWDGGSSGLNATTGRTSLGLGSAAVEDSSAFAAASHTHSYDNYQSWNLKTNGTQRTTVTSGADLDIVAGTDITVAYSAGGVVTINSTASDANNYLTGASFNTADGVITFTRQGLGDVTVDIDGRYSLTSHTHSYLPLSGGTLTGNLTANGSILGDGNLFLRSYNNDPKGIFFRDGFEYGDTNQYNLSITCYDDGDGAADGMNINAYDGIFFNVASGTTPNTKFRVLSNEVRAYANFITSGTVTASGGNSTNWNSAYSDRLKWDGGSSGLNATTGRTSLGLGSAAVEDSSAFAAASHTHSYLPLSGGTLTGSLTLRNNTTADGSIIRDLEWNSTSAQGTDDRLALIRVYTSGGTTTDRGGEMRIYTRQAGSSAFNTMTFDRSGQLTVPSAIYAAGGHTVWHAGNDGSGSGLDADLLDGINLAGTSNNGVTWNIVPRIKSDGVMEVGRYIDFHHTSNDGFDYAARLHTNGSSNGVLYLNNNKIWTAGNDGSGSGLDADLLDGNHASAFALSSHTHSYLPLSGGTLTGSLVATSLFGQNIYVTSSGTIVTNRIDNDGNNLYITYGGATNRALNINNTNGRVSLGSASASGVLDIATTSGYEIYFSGTSPSNIWGASGHMYIATSSGNDLRLGANGTNSIMNIVGDRVGINTTTPNTDSALTVNAKVGGTYTLRVSGDTLFSAGHVYTSGAADYDIGTDANRWRVVYCETLDSAGIHEANLANKKVGELPTGTPLVWKDGEAVASTQLADYMKIGIAVEGSDSPLVHGAEPVLCVGEVNEGDYLITSEKVGHAEAITREAAKEQDLMDCVIGKALENGNGESHLIKTWLTI